MKTILLSAYACVPNHGSEERNGWNYATLLSQEGLTVHCITREKGRTAIDPILADGYYPNLTVHYVAMPAWLDKAYSNLIGMYFHYLYWQWKAALLGRKLDQQYAFDLVHHVTYGSIQLGSFMYRVGKPFIFGPVGGGQHAPEVLKAYFGRYWSREKLRSWISTLLQYANPGFYRTMKLADRVLVSNTDTFQLARRFRPTKPIDRAPDVGFNESFMPPSPIRRTPGETLRLLWVGRLMPRKALELTIHAFSKVDARLPITLTVVGGLGEMVEQVPHYLDKYGVRDRVEHVGHVSFDEVKTYYEQSDVFFFTSLRDSGPMQIIEAMAYSLPCVTLAIHGQNELVSPNTGIKVPVKTVEQVTDELAKAIEWMYEHPEERLAMGDQAYRFAQSQVWENKIRKYAEELYPALLAKDKTSGCQRVSVPRR